MNGDQMPRTLSVVEMTGFLVKFLILSPLESLKSSTLVLISPGVKLRVQMTLSRPFTIRIVLVFSVRTCHISSPIYNSIHGQWDDELV